MAINKNNETFFKKSSYERTRAKNPKNTNKNSDKKRFYKKKWFLVTVFLLFIVLGTGGYFAYKTGYVLNKISEKNQSNIGSLFNALPVVGKKDDIKQDDQGRTNILLVGMRGENMPGGGLLADTIMLVTLKPSENKVGIVSIPRDLYVKIPDSEQKSKINSIYYYGEQKRGTTGLQEMKKTVSSVTGLDTHYSSSINFEGFKQLIDAVGGIEINLETPFYEVSQFVQGNECGGEFVLPQGENVLSGEQALCYVRARTNTSDFDRAKRQQVVLKKLKDKLVSLGTLSNFSKINDILNAVGNNVKTDMDTNEMKKFLEKYNGLKDAEIHQRVLENSEEGLLKVPEDAAGELGYILIPRAGWDNYSDIHHLCQNIFSLPEQSDINPVKQHYKPQPKPLEDDEDKKKKKDDDKEDDDKVEDKDKKSDDSDEEEEEEEEESEDDEEEESEDEEDEKDDSKEEDDDKEEADSDEEVDDDKE
ncbi:MAG: LCP family protein [Patescibacteria group bacterium]